MLFNGPGWQNAIVPTLTLALPWVQAAPQQVDDLIIRRGRNSVLKYEDGIELDVRLVDPSGRSSPEALVTEAHKELGPGRVVLVAGAVPAPWRSRLREADLSFIDVSGIVEINWPRLRVSARRFGRPSKRRRSPLPLQKGYALVVHELLIAAAAGESPTITEVADSAGVSLPTASRAISQFEGHGLVTKERQGGLVRVHLADRIELAELLAARTAWPGDEALSGYLWGRTVFDVAARVSKSAEHAEVGLAVTGRVGAAFHGVLGASSPTEVRCWVDLQGRRLPEVAGRLGLDPAPVGAANVILCSDPWRVGVHRRGKSSFGESTATVAHPVRVWCDLRSERRGAEFAAQLWGAVAHAW